MSKVCRLLNWDEDPNTLRYLDARGNLIIPTDCPKKYRWWQGGQSVESTTAELSTKKKRTMNQKRVKH